MLRLILILISALASAPALALEVHSSHCLHGCPFGSPASNDLVIRENYILNNNDLTKFADWVAYKVTRDTIGRTQSRTWKADPWLAENETLEPNDYVGANAALDTERGHQAPLASFTSTETWRETNYLSNITPQQEDLNGGAWRVLEAAVRTLAGSLGVEGVYVSTGTLYESPRPSLPGADEAHIVPSGYWKIVAVETSEVTTLAAFMFDQEYASRRSFCDALTTPSRIEDASGLTFFHELPEVDADILTADSGTLAGRLGCSSLSG
jgi:endonuclease G